jgi:hypothetical protein
VPSPPERLVRLDRNSLCSKVSHDPWRRPPHARTTLFHIHAHNVETGCVQSRRKITTNCTNNG